MLKKRGQITLFIIVGILIVALAGVFLYIRSETIGIEEPEVIPSELIPVKEYVQGCLDIVLTRGVILMGQQGGYLYPPDALKNDPSGYLAPVEGGGMKIPYWYHNGKSYVPEIKDMESQLSMYVQQNLKPCLRNFAPMNDQFEIAEAGNITSKMTIGVNEVITTVKYPLNIKVKGTSETTRISTFASSVPVKLKQMHDLAFDIMLSEGLSLYLESLTIDLMALGPDIPFSDVIFQCGQLRWYKPDVEAAVKNLLYYNLPKIRFSGTEHEAFMAPLEKYENLRQYSPEDIAEGDMPKDIPADAYDYFHFYWQAASKDYSGLKAAVMFQKEWPFEMTVKPSQGDIMSASYGKGFAQYLSYLCMNVYHFTYDIQYPVEVVIMDETAFQGNGYRFKFAFPVMIYHNKGERRLIPSLRTITPEGNDGKYCDETTPETYEIRAKNSKTFEDITGANVTFNCMNTYYCDLGSTKSDGGIYRLRSKLPTFCAPGTIDVKHEDYLDSSEEVPADKYYIPVFMTPLRELSIEAKKYRLTAGELMPQESLEEGEYAVIYLRSDNFTDYNIYRRYPFQEDDPEDFMAMKIPAVDAVYDIDVILMSAEDDPIGGYRSRVAIKGSDVSSASRIIFNSIEAIPHPESDEDKARMLVSIGSKNYTDRIKVQLG